MDLQWGPTFPGAGPVGCKRRVGKSSFAGKRKYADISLMHPRR
jgi:hypothetical protein